jgi:hypothetical protein
MSPTSQRPARDGARQGISAEQDAEAFTDKPANAQRIFDIRLVTADPGAVRRLRQFLKTALRRHRLRCVHVSEKPSAPRQRRGARP